MENGQTTLNKYITGSFCVVVTGTSVHSPIQMNTTYMHMVGWYIYNTRRPEHPHLPICRYKWRPQGPAPQPHCMESCPYHGRATSTAKSTAMATSTSLCIYTAVTITVRTAPLYQDPTHCCISYPELALSSSSAVPCWQPFPTEFDSNYFSVWLNLPVFRFDYTHLFFYLIILNCFSIWSDSPVFRFD